MDVQNSKSVKAERFNVWEYADIAEGLVRSFSLTKKALSLSVGDAEQKLNHIFTERRQSELGIGGLYNERHDL